MSVDGNSDDAASVFAYHVYFGLPFPGAARSRPGTTVTFPDHGPTGPGQQEATESSDLPDVLRARPARSGQLALGRRAARRAARSRELAARRRRRPDPAPPRDAGCTVATHAGLSAVIRAATSRAVERPADPAVRTANLRRIGRLFRPYTREALVVALLILVSSGLGVIPAVPPARRSSTTPIPERPTCGLLSVLVGGDDRDLARHRRRSASSSRYLSTQVGQSVMHDLRTRGLPAPAAPLARVLHQDAHRRGAEPDRERHRRRRQRAHLDRDVRHVDDHDVIATVIAMFLLELAAGAVRARADAGLRADHAQGRRGSGARSRRSGRSRWPTSSSLVQESLSVSGILLGKTMGRSAELAERFDGESQRLAGLEVRSRMTGRWMMAVDPDDVRGHAGGGLLVRRLEVLTGRAISIGTLVAFTTLQTRLFAPIGSLLSDLGRRAELARALRPHLRVPRPAGRHRGGHARRSSTCAATCGSTTSGSATATATWALSGVDIEIPAGTTTAIVGETGAGQDDARLPRLAALRRRPRGASRSTASTCAS